MNADEQAFLASFLHDLLKPLSSFQSQKRYLIYGENTALFRYDPVKIMFSRSPACFTFWWAYVFVDDVLYIEQGKNMGPVLFLN